MATTHGVTPDPSDDRSGSDVADVATLAEAVAHLTERGYRGDFKAEERGLREVFSGELYSAEQLQIDALFRFEGETDPADQAEVFALSDLAGVPRGTYVVAFGPGMPRHDARALNGLRDARER